jgi:hypothetical protein
MRIAFAGRGSMTLPDTIPDYIGVSENSNRLIGAGPEIRVIIQELFRIWETQVQADSVRFHGLATRWKADVEYVSSISEMVQHESYQAIVQMGFSAVPLILWELRTHPDHWFVALSQITGADPVLPHQRGNLQAMADAWIKWGRDNGYSV